MDLEVNDTDEIYLCATESKCREYKDFLDDLKQAYNVIPFSDIDNEKICTVLVLGGDGTVNYLVNNISSFENVRVIYLPCGTANDFAKSVKLNVINPSVSMVNEILDSNMTIEIPIMSCNSIRFINVATAGAPARVTESGTDLIKKYTGKMSYYLSAIEELVSPSVYKIKYKYNERDYEELDTFGFVVSQGLFAGGGVKISPRMVTSFGDTFSFVTMSNESLSANITSLLQLQKTNIDGEDFSESFIFKQVKSLSIGANKEIEIKLDGEEYKSKELYFKKENKYLTLHLY